MDLTNKDTVLRINECIKIVMVNKSKSIEEIPLILVLLTELIGEPLDLAELEICISELHKYILVNYDVFENSEEMHKFNDTFTLCSKLLLYQPNIKKQRFKLLPCI